MKLLVVSCVVAAACSGGSHGVDAPGGGSGSGSGSGGGACSLTLSGALTGTYVCRANTGYDSSNNKGGLAVTVVGAPEQISIGIGWMGMPQVHSYTQADADANGGVGIVMGTNVWAANAATSSSPAVGTYDLTLTSLGMSATNGTQTAYTAHGSLSASAPPRSGGGANVTVSMTF